MSLEGDPAFDDFVDLCFKWDTLGNWMLGWISRFLQPLLSVAVANAILGRGKMFCLSGAMVRQLLGKTGSCGSLLDIGAGVGTVTERLGTVFDSVHCTEASMALVRRLRAKGFTATSTLDPTTVGGTYDVVAMLNVLDRTSNPLELLESCKQLLKDDGSLLLACVVPWSPFKRVFEGAMRLTRRSENWWERSAVAMCANFEDLGWEVKKISRVPYLSEGDWRSPIYVLDDCIFVLTPTRTTTCNRVSLTWTTEDV
eukprot:GEMP01044871.1.p1 GENE.GEMP01044871.1~~GEMP01044871.1.p1  ORF type:complete len:299 (-),score=33.35 GEMP01044871.1:882-1646(-)